MAEFAKCERHFQALFKTLKQVDFHDFSSESKHLIWSGFDGAKANRPELNPSLTSILCRWNSKIEEDIVKIWEYLTLE